MPTCPPIMHWAPMVVEPAMPVCGHNGVVPDVDVVGDLDEVVQLHAPAQHRRSKGGPVDGGPGSNFASFPQHDIADLRHFFVPG